MDDFIREHYCNLDLTLSPELEVIQPGLNVEIGINHKEKDWSKKLELAESYEDYCQFKISCRIKQAKLRTL